MATNSHMRWPVALIVSMPSHFVQLPQPGFPWVSPTAGGATSPYVIPGASCMADMPRYHGRRLDLLAECAASQANQSVHQLPSWRWAARASVGVSACPSLFVQ